jgi:CRISPR/Cas system-associated endonuclease Cas3-HD
MGLSNNKLVLIYGFNEEEIVNIGEVILANEIAKLKVIDSGMTTMKIGNIIEGLKIPTANKKVSDQKVILFNNLEDEELQKSITTLKPIAKADTIFAVVTATSIEWEFQELLEHLIEERKWVTKRKK